MIGLDRFWGSHAYLNAAAGAFIVACGAIVFYTKRCPLQQPRSLPDAGVVDLEVYPGAKLFGAVVAALTLALYVVFW